MKGLTRLWKPIYPFRWWVAASLMSNILMGIFTVVSVPAIIPFLDILFGTVEVSTPAETGNQLKDFIGSIQYWASLQIETYGRPYTLGLVCVGLVIIFLLKNLFRYLALFFMAPVRTGVVKQLRQQLFQKISILPLSYFAKTQTGDLISRMTLDVQEVEISILNVIETIFREPIIIIGCLAYMLLISPSLTAIVFILLLFTALVIGGIGSRLKRQSAVAQTYLGSITSTIEETLVGLRIIKAFNAASYQQNRFDQHNQAFANQATRVLWRRDLASPLSEFLGIAVVALLLWFGAQRVFAGELDAATFMSFLYAFFNIINPSKALSNAYFHFQKGLAALDRSDELLLAPDKLVEAPNPNPVEQLSHHLTFKNVSFRYENGSEDVLKEINLEIPKGKTIALVGMSGAGKSTLIDLVARFYDPTEGEILLDGQNLQSYRLGDVRNLMGMVSQEAILFNDSIAENIRFGVEGITQIQIEAAAKQANAHEFISNFPNQYDTNIGDRGNLLSGGQRQRIAIARALLRDPQILILDEATSALDTETEQQVQEALEQLQKSRTVIVIAHRLSTVRNADEIVVLHQGQIIERGTHQKLMDQQGEYFKLVSLQHMG